MVTGAVDWHPDAGVRGIVQSSHNDGVWRHSRQGIPKAGSTAVSHSKELLPVDESGHWQPSRRSSAIQHVDD